MGSPLIARLYTSLTRPLALVPGERFSTRRRAMPLRLGIQAFRYLGAALAPGPRLVALTFSDGPSPMTTQALLAVLRQHRVPAAFFCAAGRTRQWPRLVRAIAAAGMDVGSATHRHRSLVGESLAVQSKSIAEGIAAVTEATGWRPTLLRPPKGHFDRTTLRCAQTYRQTICLWNIEAESVLLHDGDVIAQHVIDEATTPAIIRLPDGIPSIIDALPHIIRTYRQAGYRFTTLSGLTRHQRHRRRLRLPVAVRLPPHREGLLGTFP